MKNIIQKLGNARTDFNDKVREFGNNKTKRIKEFSGKGLGDLLTTDVNFRKAGATAGALVPLAFYYQMGSLMGMDEGSNEVINTIAKGIFASLCYGVTYYMSIPASAILGRLGYGVGRKVDKLIGDKSLKIKEEGWKEYDLFIKNYNKQLKSLKENQK